MKIQNIMFYSLPILTITEVGNKIKLKDDEAIKKWLKSKDISTFKVGKSLVVYEIDVDCQMDKARVEVLRKQFPNDWIELYKKICKDSAVYEMVLHSLGGNVLTKPTTSVKPINKMESELYNKYAK